MARILLVQSEFNYLLNELDLSKNNVDVLSGIAPHSHKKVWWECYICNYSWSTSVSCRTSGTGCPNCAGLVVNSENNLKVVFPDLSLEWDYTKNKITPDKIHSHSSKRVWWICLVCGWKWEAIVRSRSVGNGCPSCAGRVVSDRNNLLSRFPGLVCEWDYERNELRPEAVFYGSGKKVWWICRKCGYSWLTSPNKRTAVGCGCPKCAGKIVDGSNSLLNRYPNIAVEWDYNKNIGMSPATTSYGADKKIWWRCSVCDNSWAAMVYHRVGGTGCPRCTGRYLDETTSLKARYPEIALDWDYSRNTLRPEDIHSGSNKRVYWVCNRCGYLWESSVGNRTCRVRGCPRCARSGISYMSQKWLDSLNIPAENREVWLEVGGKKFRVDGFDPKSNTVYEFLGDYWHGNPEVFSAEDTNTSNKETFGYLYDKTVHRFKLLRENGYNLVYIWERDYSEGYKEDKNGRRSK